MLSHKFYPDLGGIETVSEILAHEFVKAGHEVRILTWSSDIDSKVFPFKLIRRPSLIKIFYNTLWASVVLENNLCTRLSWPAILLNIPVVTVLQTWIARTNGNVTLIDKLKLLKLRRSKKVIAISKAVQDNIFRESIIIPNPFKTDVF